MNLAPIVLFVYNRPWHTRKTIDSLQRNEFAKESELFIFSDGPKDKTAVASVREIRQYIQTISGFKQIRLIERKKNWGLAASIIDGVTQVVEEYGRAIVLEDDLILSPIFLRFMNEALDFYKQENLVMHVSGYMFPVHTGNPTETVFLKPTSCWGWATWDRAWRFFEKDANKLVKIFTPEMIKDFNLDGAYDYFSHILMNIEGRINTWAIFWYASVFLQNGLSLHPKSSLTVNIGHDGSGNHCGRSDKFATDLSTNWPIKFNRQIAEDVVWREKVKQFYCSHNPSYYKRILQALKRKIERRIDAVQ